MKNIERLSEMDRHSEVQSVSHLVNLYGVTMDKLRLCASVDPALEEDLHAADIREANLLNVEAKLLDQAASMPLNSKADVLILMDIWAKASGIEEGQELRPTDRIAMNIFRHMNTAKFSAE